MNTDQDPENPITTKTRAILLKLEQMEGKLNKMQDVTDAVKMVRQMHAESETWKSVLYRMLKEATSLLFSDREKRK